MIPGAPPRCVVHGVPLRFSAGDEEGKYPETFGWSCPQGEAEEFDDAGGWIDPETGEVIETTAGLIGAEPPVSSAAELDAADQPTDLVDVDGPPPPEQVAPPPRILARIRSGKLTTPADVEDALVAVLEKLDQGVAFQSAEERKLARLEEEYRVAYARALLAAQNVCRTDALRKAHAELATAELGDALSVQRITVKTTRDAMHNLRAILTGVQSLGKSVAASYNAGGGPGDPRP